MATALDIVNRALRMLGEPKLTALTDTGKSAEGAVDLFFDAWRDCQEEDDWYFFVSRALLSETTSVTHYTGYEYVYTLPSDLATPIDLYPRRTDYIIEQVSGVQYLFTDYEPDTTNEYPRLIYQAEVLSAATDSTPVISATFTSLIPSWYTSAVAGKLAMELAYFLTEDDTVHQRMQQRYYINMKRARQHNAMYTPGPGPGQDLWSGVT
jgi:hypothetical protein